MHEYFVWTTLSFIEIIGAASMEDAAEEYLGRPVTRVPIANQLPACFVQPTGGAEMPNPGVAAIEFWAV